MAWGRGDPVAEIDVLIEKHRGDQRAQQHLLEDAVVAERNAIDAEYAAQAIQTRCRKAIDADVDEIDRLLDERERLIPAQRRGDG